MPTLDCEILCQRCGAIEWARDHCSEGHHMIICKFCREQDAYDRSEEARNVSY